MQHVPYDMHTSLYCFILLDLSDDDVRVYVPNLRHSKS